MESTRGVGTRAGRASGKGEATPTAVVDPHAHSQSGPNPPLRADDTGAVSRKSIALASQPPFRTTLSLSLSLRRNFLPCLVPRSYPCPSTPALSHLSFSSSAVLVPFSSLPLPCHLNVVRPLNFPHSLFRLLSHSFCSSFRRDTPGSSRYST